MNYLKSHNTSSTLNEVTNLGKHKQQGDSFNLLEIDILGMAFQKKKSKST